MREAMEGLALELSDMERQLAVIKEAQGLPVEPFSMRDESEFYE